MSKQFRVKNSWRLAIVVVSFVGAGSSVMAMERVSQLEGEIMAVVDKFDTSNYDLDTNDGYQKLKELIPQYREAVDGRDGYFSIYGDIPQHARDDSNGQGYKSDPAFISMVKVTEAIFELRSGVLDTNRGASLFRSLDGLRSDLYLTRSRFIARWTMFYKAAHSEN